MPNLLKHVLHSLALGGLALLAGCTSAPTSLAYPADAFFDHPEVSVAVMRLQPGAELPEFDECKKPGVWCMHSPFWLRGEVIAPVYGKPRMRHMPVLSSGHYGTSWYADQDDPWLVVLLDDGKDIVMPTYASTSLVRRNDGALFVIVDYEREPDFLPCSIAGLREEIDQTRFPRNDDLQLPADDPAVMDDPQLYTISNGHAFPRYGIAVSRIATALAMLRPTTAKDFDCPKEAS